jgi:hypothetical protein
MMAVRPKPVTGRSRGVSVQSIDGRSPRIASFAQPLSLLLIFCFGKSTRAVNQTASRTRQLDGCGQYPALPCGAVHDLSRGQGGYGLSSTCQQRLSAAGSIHHDQVKYTRQSFGQLLGVETADGVAVRTSSRQVVCQGSQTRADRFVG